MNPPNSPTATSLAQNPSDPQRVKAFARFFKNYMSVSAVVAAALPIPVTSLKLIPTYAAQTSILSTYTTFFCFLTLGFIFYSRHHIGRLMFPEILDRGDIHSLSQFRVRRFKQALVAYLPALLILCSLICVYFYHWLLDITLGMLGGRSLTSTASTKASALLALPETYEIPAGNALMFWYLGIFVFAEAAFVLMAMKEYIQDLVRLTETDIIARRDETPDKL